MMVKGFLDELKRWNFDFKDLYSFKYDYRKLSSDLVTWINLTKVFIDLYAKYDEIVVVAFSMGNLVFKNWLDL